MIEEKVRYYALCDNCGKELAAGDIDNIVEMFEAVHAAGWLMVEARIFDPHPVYCTDCRKQHEEP